MDSVGWGSPFLLVPEVSNIDNKTKDQLAEATEKDLYRSNISPLGVPFNSLRNSSMDVAKMGLFMDGKPGSPCPKRFLVSSKEYSENAICTASKQYQAKKISELDILNLSKEEYKVKVSKIIDKSCLCVGLGNTALKNIKDNTKQYVNGTTICPGPNMAYFSQTVSLKKMVDHIYGKINIIQRKDRPHMFIKELTLYIDFLKSKIEDFQKPVTPKEIKYLQNFQKNLDEGILYYKNIFSNFKDKMNCLKDEAINELESFEKKIKTMVSSIE